MEENKTRIEDKIIPYKVRQSSRAKRPNLKLKNGNIIVSIPENADLSPEKLLEENSDQTVKYWQSAKKFREKIPERNFEENESFKILGEKKEIIVEKRRSNEIDNNIRLAEHLIEQTSLKDQLEKSLREHARKVFKIKSKKYSDRIHEEFEKIFIRDQKTRWGSCSSKNNLNFNWRLVLGPEHVLEYVVVHELVHLEHSNHGREFWSRVEKLYPDYKRSDNWLSKNGAKLVFEEDIV